MEALGYLPSFLDLDDPRPAREQLHSAYGHGGGWRPFKGFTMQGDGNISYLGDPPIKLLAETTLGQELVRFYEHSWVGIIQPDGIYEISRMD